MISSQLICPICYSFNSIIDIHFDKANRTNRLGVIIANLDIISLPFNPTECE